jgi:hypothetical protein
MNKLIAAGLAIAFSGLTHYAAFSQEREMIATPGPAYAPFSLSLSGGVNLPATDVQKSTPSGIIGIGASYQPQPYLSLQLDLQKGWLKEGKESEAGTMRYTNSYLYAAVLARLFPFNFVDTPNNRSFKSHIYVGLGLALIKSDVDARPLAPSFGYENYQGAAMLIPVEIGGLLPLWHRGQQRLGLNINLRQHFSFSDQLDGYEPITPANKHKDTYGQLTIGLAYGW